MKALLIDLDCYAYFKESVSFGSLALSGSAQYELNLTKNKCEAKLFSMEEAHYLIKIFRGHGRKLTFETVKDETKHIRMAEAVKAVKRAVKSEIKEKYSIVKLTEKGK